MPQYDTSIATHHFVYLFAYSIAHGRDIFLQRIHERLDVPLHLLRREAQLSHSHPDYAQSLPILASTNQIPHTAAHLRDHCARLRARHQSLGTKLSSQPRLVHLLQAVNVTQAPVKLDYALFDLRKNIVLADQHGARCPRLGRRL